MSSLIPKIIEQAEYELDEAFEYYEYELSGLGKQFINSFNHAINRIITHPTAWTCIKENVRKCRLDKFPFDIIYALEEEFVVIVAISHHHRKPFYWIERLSD